MARLEDLQAMRDGLVARMAAAESDQNYAVMGRLLKDVIKEIDELGGGERVAPKETGLSDFEKRLRERESSAKGSRRPKSG